MDGGGGWVAQTKYCVTPTWVEVGLDWIGLCKVRLGWVGLSQLVLDIN